MSVNKTAILIVEDERPLAHAFELKLQHEGFSTTVTRDGKAGLEALAKGDYAIMLLDMMMPVMDGFQVLQELAKTPEKKPIVFVLSNLSQSDDAEGILKAGADKFFIKSNTSLAEIVEEIKKALQE
jgi:DNA-binding response OmpR family regulator